LVRDRECAEGADHGNRDFTEILRVNVALYLADDGFDLLRADGPLITRLFQAAPQLGGVEGLARFILLDDLERRLFHVFDGHDAALALRADALPADGEPTTIAARIDDREITLTAERAFRTSVGPRDHRSSIVVL